MNDLHIHCGRQYLDADDAGVAIEFFHSALSNLTRAENEILGDMARKGSASDADRLAAAADLNILADNFERLGDAYRDGDSAALASHCQEQAQRCRGAGSY